MNKNGQIGQTFTTMTVFILLVILLGVWIYLSSAAALLSRGPAQATSVNSKIAGTEIAESNDALLKQPILLTPANGHSLTIPLYRAVFLYYTYSLERDSIDKKFQNKGFNNDKYEIARTNDNLELEGINYQVLDSGLRSFFAQKVKGQIGQCFVIGIASDTHLNNRLNSPQEAFGKSLYADFFYSFEGTSVEKLNRQTFALKYRNILSSPDLVSVNLQLPDNYSPKEIILQYYLGSCSGDKNE